MGKPGHNQSLLQLHLSIVLFGFTGLFGKWLTLPAMVIVFGRVTFAFVALLVLLRLSGQNFRLKDKSDYRTLMLPGMLLAFHWVAFFQSIQVSTVAIGLISLSTFPLFTTLLEPLFFREERLSPAIILLALLVIIGVAVATPTLHLDNGATQGILWGIAAGLSYALLTLCNRRQVGRYSSLVITFYQQGMVLLLLLPAMFVLRPTITPHDLGLLALLGIIFTGLAQILFIQSMRHVTASLASVLVAGLEVVYGVLLAALLLNEIPTLRTIIGGTIILCTALGATALAHKGMAPLPITVVD